MLGFCAGFCGGTELEGEGSEVVVVEVEVQNEGDVAIPTPRVG